MQEDFLHYIWKHKKFELNNLETTQGKAVVVTSVGQHNFNSGPDFFNAQLKIGEQLWAGNVEIHVKSSDWFLHNHEQDKAYDTVILHVVWEHDTDVFRNNNTAIPTLQLKDFINKDLLNNYEKLFSKNGKWIHCENDFASVDDFLLNNWLERLYFERLERKAETIQSLLEETKNDWEAVFFIMLAKNFGLKVNGESFYSMAKSIDFSVLRKSQANQQTLEALFFGQSGLLEHDYENAYYLTLVKEYHFLKQKFKLENNSVVPLQFFRLRPPNFPTIRLSQLASLYFEHKNLFSKVMETESLESFYKLFKVSTSSFWNNHYTFQKTSKASTKALTKSFIDLLLINTILPIKFCYSKEKGQEVDALVLKIASEIASEKNNIVEAFNGLKNVSKSSLQSQALIQLKNEYCSKNKCLQCAIGSKLINN
ncbi:uncharacterized protein DUF2851 [Mariniflexile fucanivorans]|uniref:Uncharacterized protein DUF2851 n=1 Tax=Mariniflexile fucanivorans TaxID=264023 RepID=A0A4R1RL77_9FLAO|nr:DUF2851 family protein [Mariniflexile fucanivorans]TCL66620.1 uncharacterized protein DUF2851 [Mariniflexile fucanivorans]